MNGKIAPRRRGKRRALLIVVAVLVLAFGAFQVYRYQLFARIARRDESLRLLLHPEIGSAQWRQMISDGSVVIAGTDRRSAVWIWMEIPRPAWWSYSYQMSPGGPSGWYLPEPIAASAQPIAAGKLTYIDPLPGVTMDVVAARSQLDAERVVDLFGQAGWKAVPLFGYGARGAPVQGVGGATLAAMLMKPGGTLEEYEGAGVYRSGTGGSLILSLRQDLRGMQKGPPPQPSGGGRRSPRAETLPS